MKPTHFDILSSCQISSEKVMVNQHCILRNTQEEDWLTAIFHHIGLSYPKFFKMDRLCKAGTLAAELLLKDSDFDRDNVKTSWGIVLMNSASSLDNDRRYQQTIADSGNYYPSPSVFVYTLANIVTGEIAIRHKIGGETSFYVMPRFEEDCLQQLVGQCFLSNPELDHIICGWVNVDEQICDIQLFLTQRKDITNI